MNAIALFSSCAIALLVQTPASPLAWKAHPKASQEYTSDFVSFVGADAQGKVIFALDTNRGRDGKKFQAEHFAVLHDEKLGWIDLAGNGEYANPDGRLEGLPDSGNYQFTGTPASGWTIVGKTNDIELKLEAMGERTRSELDEEQFMTRSGPGTLTWKGRKLQGRAIYEWTYLIDDNLITDPSTGTFGSGWHGAYLFVEGGGDLRAHLTGGDFKKLLNKRSGFLVAPKAAAGVVLENLEFEPGQWSQGRGFYQWPTRWDLAWGPLDRRASVRLDLKKRVNVANWGVGAFGVAIVSGKLELDGVQREVYGLAQIVR